jgi:hypothetical protein
MSLWYYPNLPLEIAKPSTMCGDLKIKFADWQQTYGKDIIQELKQNGQLDPNICRWNGTMWAIEPGQSRWFALRELGVKYQKALVLVDNPPFNFENYEIKNRQDAEEIFLNSKWMDHHGLGYLRRRRYLK